MLEAINSILDDNFDFKTKFGNKYKYAQFLLEQLKAIELTGLPNDDLFEYMQIVDKILTRVVEVNNDAMIDEKLCFLVSQSIFFNHGNIERYNLEILKSINKHHASIRYSTVLKKYLPQLIFEIEKSKNKYFNSESYHLYRIFSEELVELYKKFDIHTEALLYSIGLSYHLEAISQQNRENKSSIVKVGFLENAEQHYKIKCKNIELSKDLRPIIKACYGFVVENELQEVKTELPKTTIYAIDSYHYKKFYTHTLHGDVLLRHMSCDKRLLPSYELVVEQAKEIAKESVFSRLINTTPINEKRKLGTYSSEAEHGEYDIARHYQFSLDITWQMHLFSLFYELINKNKLSQSVIMKHLATWSLVDKNRIAILSRGIERFFADDHISSVSILVPQIEHHLRYMFELIGYSTTNTLDGKSQDEQTFGTFLKDAFVVEKLGIDIAKYFEILFVSKVGFNIRNSIAHGFYDSNAFGKGLNIIVIYSLILLTRFNIASVGKSNE